MLAHVRKSIYFSAANNSNKEIWHMAKVSIKSEKLKRWQSYFGKEVDDENY